jgi:hypothetical protein
MKEVDQAVHVKDVVLPDVVIMNEPDLVIAKVSLRPIEVVEEVKPAAGAEAAGIEAAAAEETAEAKPGAEAKAGAAKPGAEAKAEKK